MEQRPTAHPSQGQSHSQPPRSQPPRTRRVTTAAQRSARPARPGNWLARSAQQRQRLGEWVYWTRTERLGLSLRGVATAAAAEGVGLSYETVRDLEELRNPTVAATRRQISMGPIFWLLDYSGQTLGDLDRFLRGGALATAGAPQELAEYARVRMLSLSDDRQRAVLDFIEHLRRTEELESQAAFTLAAPTTATPTPTPELLAPGAISQPQDATQDATLDADTLATLADLQRAEQRILAAQQRQAQQEMQRAKPDKADKAEDGQRRKTR